MSELGDCLGASLGDEAIGPGTLGAIEQAIEFDRRSEDDVNRRAGAGDTAHHLPDEVVAEPVDEHRYDRDAGLSDDPPNAALGPKERVGIGILLRVPSG